MYFAVILEWDGPVAAKYAEFERFVDILFSEVRGLLSSLNLWKVHV